MLAIRISAPWKPEYVAKLNRWQQDGTIHPYTCGSGNRTDERHTDGEGRLVATPDGWVCPFCDYRQTWASDYIDEPASL